MGVNINVKVFLCEYDELDTNCDNPIECTPFLILAEDYESASKKANSKIAEYYNEFHYQVSEVEEGDFLESVYIY